MTETLSGSLNEMAQGRAIVCGFWPYQLGVQLTRQGYDYLLERGVEARIQGPDCLELTSGDRKAIIGMTPALKKRLQAEANETVLGRYP